MTYAYNLSTHHLVGAQVKSTADLTGIQHINGMTVQLDNLTSFDVRLAYDNLRDSEYRVDQRVNDSLTTDDLNHIAKTFETTEVFYFYQNQLNFVVWYAVTRCGVGIKQHLQHPNLFSRSSYRYHFYFQVR